MNEKHIITEVRVTKVLRMMWLTNFCSMFGVLTDTETRCGAYGGVHVAEKRNRSVKGTWHISVDIVEGRKVYAKLLTIDERRHERREYIILW